MGINFNIIKNNIKCIFNYKVILLNVLIFILLFLFQIMFMKEYSLANLFEYIKYYFYGVNTTLENISSLLIWLLFQLFFMLIMILYINNEFQGRNIYLISRLRSKENWFLNLEFTIILSSIIYFFIGFLTLTLCSIMDNNTVLLLKENISIVPIFIILFLNSSFYVNVYLLIFISLKNNKYSFLLIILLVIINIDLGSILKIDLYNPFTQCIFFKYYMINNSFLNSIIVLLISNSLIILSLYFTIIKKDLLNSTIQ